MVSDCFSLCSACTGAAANECTACKTLNYYYFNTCYATCPDHTYPEGSDCYGNQSKIKMYFNNNPLLDCTSPCANCHGGTDSDCDSCETGYLYYSNTCLTSCPTGTFESGSNCLGNSNPYAIRN